MLGGNQLGVPRETQAQFFLVNALHDFAGDNFQAYWSLILRLQRRPTIVNNPYHRRLQSYGKYC